MTTQRRDALGDRMKRYEDITRFKLPPRTYTLLRVDGRAFHTWTRGLAKPYDQLLMKIMDKTAIALCDARVWTIPDPVEVENYFVWRQQDAVRNSVMMLARAHASHKQLHGKNQSAQHEIIHAAGDNWEKHPARFKHGGVIRRQAVDYLAQEGVVHPSFFRPSGPIPIEKSNWFMDEGTPVFTRERHYLRTMIPIHWEDDLVQRIPDHRKGTTA